MMFDNRGCKCCNRVYVSQGKVTLFYLFKSPTFKINIKFTLLKWVDMNSCLTLHYNE